MDEGANGGNPALGQARAHRRHLRQSVAAVALCMLAQSATSVAAQTWTGDTSTDWFTGSNWSGNSVPGQSGLVVVDTASPNAADVKQQLTNGPAVVESLTVGNVATATLSVLEGGEISVIGGSLIVGLDPGSDGTLVVSGSQTVDGKVAKSTLLVAGGFIIGNEGNGALTISEEGQVTGQLQIGALTGGSGTVMISGDGTAFSSGGNLFVGDQGNGTLAIEQSATVTLTDASDALFIAGLSHA